MNNETILNNKTIPTMIMIVGLPASGKSTEALELSYEFNANIHSSDEIREELSGDVNNQKMNELVFNTINKRIITDLINGKSVIFDATNLVSKKRINFLKELSKRKIECNKICVIMATPYERCLRNNLYRSRTVPQDVIARMYRSFQMPSKYEGFDEIRIEYGYYSCNSYDFVDKITKLKNIPHDNPHHSLSIGEHCIECKEQMIKLTSEKNIISTRRAMLIMASLLHDIGKDVVKDFHNGRGEKTEIAHYYSHENVGAYDCLFYLKDGLGRDEKIKVILLINHHMKPYVWDKSLNSAKFKNRFQNIYGKEMCEDLMILNMCDRLAH